MVTGSHNPPDYNGFKMMLGRKRVLRRRHPAARAAWPQRATWCAEAPGTRPSRWTWPTTTSTRLLQDWDGGDRQLRVVWDNANGAAGEVLQRLVQELPGQHTVLNPEIDGRFPAHHPGPDHRQEPGAADRRRAASRRPISASASTATPTASARWTTRAACCSATSCMVVLARDVLRDASGRHHHRRREGEPGALRRDRQGRRQAVDVQDRAQPDQGQDGGDQGARSPAR